jgi:hypothetical protein
MFVDKTYFRRILGRLVVGFVACAAVAAFVRVSLGDSKGLLVPLAVFFLLGSLYALSFGRRRFLSPKVVWPVICLAIIMAQKISLPFNGLPFDYTYYARHEMRGMDLAIQRVFEKDPRHDYRLIFNTESQEAQMSSMLATYYGIPILTSYISPVSLKNYNEMYYHGYGNSDYYLNLGARYLICKDCVAYPPPSDYRLTEVVHGYSIYESDMALPFAYFLSEEEESSRQKLALRRRVLNSFNALFNTYSLLAGSASPVPESGGKGYSAEILFRRPNEIEALVKTDRPGFVVFNDIFSDHWSVAVDGVMQTPREVNGNQIGVFVGPGIHLVWLSYWPKILGYSFFLSILGFIAMMVLLVFSFARKPLPTWTDLTRSVRWKIGR